jgi:hypothetical protein
MNASAASHNIQSSAHVRTRHSRDMVDNVGIGEFSLN